MIEGNYYVDITLDTFYKVLGQHQGRINIWQKKAYLWEEILVVIYFCRVYKAFFLRLIFDHNYSVRQFISGFCLIEYILSLLKFMDGRLPCARLSISLNNARKMLCTVLIKFRLSVIWQAWCELGHILVTCILWNKSLDMKK